MKADLAVKIAAMVSELGKLAAEYDAPPDDDAIDIIADTCTPENAAAAVTLSLSVMMTSGLANLSPDGKRLPVALLNTIELCANALTLMHTDSKTRRVPASEVLRMVATHLERTSGLESVLDAVRSITGNSPLVRVPRPDEGGNGKPGAN
jgi:hypothetical protein